MFFKNNETGTFNNFCNYLTDYYSYFIPNEVNYKHNNHVFKLLLLNTLNDHLIRVNMNNLMIFLKQHISCKNIAVTGEFCFSNENYNENLNIDTNNCTHTICIPLNKNIFVLKEKLDKTYEISMGDMILLENGEKIYTKDENVIFLYIKFITIND